ncbi:MAG: hypothetical protein ACRCYY_10720 [Trueperaceae bacterium]
MAKTILAVMQTAGDVRLARQALAQHYKLWTCSSIARSLEMLSEGIQPQLVISPFSRGEIESVFNCKHLQGVPVLLYAAPNDMAAYPQEMKRAASLLHYPISEFMLLSTVDKFLRVSSY